MSWYADRDHAGGGFWHASWDEVESEPLNVPIGLQITTTMQGDDFEELVNALMESISHEWPSDDVTLTWVLDDNAEDHVDVYGIELPDRLPETD